MTAEDTVRRRVVVRGDVQGVFFRDSTRDEAQARGVSGSVTNRADGAVEAVFEGSREAVDALIAFLPRRTFAGGCRGCRGHRRGA